MTQVTAGTHAVRAATDAVVPSLVARGGGLRARRKRGQLARTRSGRRLRRWCANCDGSILGGVRFGWRTSWPGQTWRGLVTLTRPLLRTPKNDGFAAFNKALKRRVGGRTDLRPQ